MPSSASEIRQRLQDSREDFARSLGISPERLEAIEAGEPLPQFVILKLVQYAKDRGLTLTIDQAYGIKPL